MIKSIKTFTTLAIITVALCATSCVKKDSFDDTAPSTNVDPNLTVNITIDSLKSLLTSTTPQYILEDFICAGVVIADDRSGNFYKEMVIQDATGGISIFLDQSSYYTNYFIGRRVFVKLKGLFISDVDGNIKLGTVVNGALDRIPAAVVADHLIGGKWNLIVEPKHVKVSQITPDDINTLLEIDSAQFESASFGKTFADNIHQNTVNHNVEECNGGIIIVRTSGYANFAASTVPCRAGSIKGVYQVYNYGSGFDQQLYLRDINDVAMDADRCGSITTPLTSINENFTNIPTGVTLKDTGWVVITPVGDRSWNGKLFSGNYFGDVSAYTSAGAVESWLISPPFNLATADTLNFNSATAYWYHNGLTVWFTNNFDVCNPNASVWTALTCHLAGTGSTNYVFENSLDVPLTSFSGTGYIRFKYEGNGPGGQTSTYQVDDVIIH